MKGRRSQRGREEARPAAHLQLPLGADLLAVAPHHVLHAQFAQVFRRLETQRDVVKAFYVCQQDTPGRLNWTVCGLIKKNNSAKSQVCLCYAIVFVILSLFNDFLIPK